MFDACRWLEGYMSVRQAAVPLDSGSRTLLYRDTDENPGIAKSCWRGSATL